MTGTRPLESFRALREIGIVVIALLALIVAMVVVQLLISLNSNLGGSAAPHLLSQLDRVCGIAMLAAGIVFVGWLHRARINAEYSSFRQRRARAWTFWGWIVPIVSLWIPFQVLGDIWRAGLPADQRKRFAGLPALWWTTWLLSGVTVSARGSEPRIPGLPFVAPQTWTLSLFMLAISGIALIEIIWKVSNGPVGTAARLFANESVPVDPIMPTLAGSWEETAPPWS